MTTISHAGILRHGMCLTTWILAVIFGIARDAHAQSDEGQRPRNQILSQRRIRPFRPNTWNCS